MTYSKEEDMNEGKRMVTLTFDEKTWLLTLNKDQICLLKWLMDQDVFCEEMSYEIQNTIIDPSSEVNINEIL